MAIILSDLYGATKKNYHLQLIAGDSGLNTPIHWVQFTEDIATTHFLKGGELIITTGMSSDSDKWLCEFITRLIKQNTCGLILNTGRYIFFDSISDEVIALCNEHHFPLFTMPWKIHLATIMQDYCNRIFMQSYQEDRTTMAFQRLLLHPEEPETSVDTLTSLGYEANASYLVMVCQHINAPAILAGGLRKLGTRQFLFRLNDSFVFIFQNTSIDTLTQNLADLSEINAISMGPSACYGIGDLSDSLLKLHLSFKHAGFALKIAQKQALRQLCFDDLGLFKILFSVTENEILTNMSTNNLEQLEAYDARGNTNLVETLRLYIEHDGSIQAVADASFTHRNTINYRMKKIRQLLNMDLVSMEEKFNLRLAFLIRDFLSLY